MTPHSQHPSHQQPPQSDQDLPSIVLPPAPFGRASRAAAVTTMLPVPLPAPSTPSTTIERPTPRGSSIDALLAQISAPFEMEQGPVQAFSAAVERRAARPGRRAERRDTPERRTFASQFLAAPDSGPVDPRPTAPPTNLDGYLPGPISPRMPLLPDVSGLEPARPWAPATRPVTAPAALRTSRPGVHVPFAGAVQATPPPPPPRSAPGPAPASIAALAISAARPPAPVDPAVRAEPFAPAAPAETFAPAAPAAHFAPAAPAAPAAHFAPAAPAAPAAHFAPAAPAETLHAAPGTIDDVFGPTGSTPWGQLTPSTMYASDAELRTAADEALARGSMPLGGPAGPAFAPGAGLPLPIAAAAATPAAWFGGTTQVDDGMLVWNTPGAVVSSFPIGASTLTEEAAADDSGPRRSPLLTLLMVLLSSGAGIGAALLIHHFVS